MRRWWAVARAHWFALGMAAIALGLLTSALVGERGLIRVAQLREELRTASGQNFRLLQSVDRLRKRLHAIRTDDTALERLARQRLRLVRDGETIYRIEPEGRPDAQATVRPDLR